MKRIVPRVKLIAGLLWVDDRIMEKVKRILYRKFGRIDYESRIIPFIFTRYYNKELGEGIKRQYISFSRLIDPFCIRRIKIYTNKLEDRFRVDGNRQVNIDPGFVCLDKMVLASTKDATYRVYLGRGIYAQSTYYFQKGTYNSWEWTYPDYREPDTIAFFNMVRNAYREQIRAFLRSIS